jgi:hypothetical protein
MAGLDSGMGQLHVALPNGSDGRIPAARDALVRDQSDRSKREAAVWRRGKERAYQVRFYETYALPIKGPWNRWFWKTYFAQSRCPLSEASFLRSSSTTQTGEALSAQTLHHRHHAVVLSIPSTTPPYIVGPGRRSRWCAVYVHLSEASPLAALDRIGSRGGEG